MKLKTLLSLAILFYSHFSLLQAQWESLGSDVDASGHSIWGISAVDAEVAWAISSAYPAPGDHLVRTGNGGISWKVTPFAIDSGLFAIQLFALDEMHAWLAAADELNPISGKLFQTIDGGISWIEQSDAFTGFNQTPAAVHFWNDNEGVAFGATCYDDYQEQVAIYFTENGGSNWTKVSGEDMPTQLQGEGMCLFSGNGFYDVAGDNLWFVSSKNRIFKSADRGQNWTVNDHLNINTGVLSSLAFKDELNGIAISLWPNRAFSTSDGGITWTAIGIPSFTQSAAIEYIPGTEGTFLIHDGQYANDPDMLLTYNSGEHWEHFTSNISLNCLQFLSPSVGFGGGVVNSPTTGGIYRWDGMPLTSSREPLANQPFHISPNPAQSHIRIQLPVQSTAPFYAQVLDARGRVVAQTRLTNGAQLDVELLPGGIYWLKVQAEGKIYVEKFVKS